MKSALANRKRLGSNALNCPSAGHKSGITEAYVDLSTYFRRNNCTGIAAIYRLRSIFSAYSLHASQGVCETDAVVEELLCGP